MKLKLTESQLIELEERLKANIREETKKRKEQEQGKDVCGWDFVGLLNEIHDIKEVLKNKYIII